MDKALKDISNEEKKLNLLKLYELDNINSYSFKNVIIFQLLESKELLYVIEDKKSTGYSYIIELYDLIQKKLLLTQTLQDGISGIILLDNNDIAYFLNSGIKMEENILTVNKGTVEIINITNPEKKIITCETPELEDHSLFCDLFPLTIKDKSGAGIAFDYEIYIFLKSNEEEKYENFKKIENFGTLSDYYIYKNYFVSYGFEQFNYFNIDKNFELKTYDKYDKEEFNIKVMFLYQNSKKKVQINDNIFIYPLKKQILFFDADKCESLNILDIKGNEFNIKGEFLIKQILYLNDYLLLFIQTLSNNSLNLIKYSIDLPSLNVKYISNINLGNLKNNYITFQKNKLYIVKNINNEEDKNEKLYIYDIDI